MDKVANREVSIKKVYARYENNRVTLSEKTDLIQGVSILYEADDLIIFRVDLSTKRPSVVATSDTSVILAPSRESPEREQLCFEGIETEINAPFLHGWIPNRYCFDVQFMSYEVERDYSRSPKS